MHVEVFNIETNDVLAKFKHIQDADRFIASFENTSLQHALQIREDKATYVNSHPILRICRGWPGSGKTTFAIKHFPGIFHVENDMFLMRGGKYTWSKDRVKMAINWCSKTARNALENGLDVIVCNTFTKRKFISFYQNMASECDAEFQVYRCVGNFQNVHGLDDNMVQNFKNAMEDWPGEIVVESF